MNRSKRRYSENIRIKTMNINDPVKNNKSYKKC
jgi:hypothetical protein